jgi:uncharacterized protein YoaH (UPF0181 family)
VKEALELVKALMELGVSKAEAVRKVSRVLDAGRRRS